MSGVTRPLLIAFDDNLLLAIGTIIGIVALIINIYPTQEKTLPVPLK